MITVKYKSNLTDGIVSHQYANRSQAEDSLRHMAVRRFSALEDGKWNTYELDKLGHYRLIVAAEYREVA